MHAPRSGEPVPEILEFIGWQGDLDTEPMLFLFLHRQVHSKFEQRFLIFSIRHAMIAQRHVHLTPALLLALLSDFRTCRNEVVFRRPPPLGSFGEVVRRKRRR